MTAIWKFQLPREPSTSVKLPHGAKFRHISWQNNRPTVWYEVDDTAPPTPRTIRCVCTGEDVPNPAGNYLGTLHEWPFVWHFYEDAA